MVESRTFPDTETVALMNADAAVAAAVEGAPKVRSRKEVYKQIQADNDARTLERSRAAADSGSEEDALNVANNFFASLSQRVGQELSETLWDAERGTRSLNVNQNSLELRTWLTVWPGQYELESLESYKALVAGLASRGYRVSLNGTRSSIQRGTYALIVDVSWVSPRADTNTATGTFATIPSAKTMSDRISAANKVRSEEVNASVNATSKEGKPLNTEDPEERLQLLIAGKAFLLDVIVSVGIAIEDALRDSKRASRSMWLERPDLYELEDYFQPFLAYFGTDPKSILEDLRKGEEFALLTQKLTNAGYGAPKLSSTSSQMYPGTYSLKVTLF